MTTNPVLRAKLYVALDEVKSRIDNEILPLAAHCGLAEVDTVNDRLINALEELSEAIREHLSSVELTARRVINAKL